MKTAKDEARDYCKQLGLETDILQQFEVDVGPITDSNLTQCCRWLETLETTVWKLAS